MIRVQNVYYMLTYAFQLLKQQGYKSVAAVDFPSAGDMMAAILIKGIEKQIKRGLKKDYISKTEALTSLRGKIDISESVKKQTLQKRQMVCSYDDFSVNSYMNRIIKTTICVLLKANIRSEHRKSLRKLLVYFNDVEILEIHKINWNIRYDRNNQTYMMIISICRLVIKGLLQTQSDGKYKLMDFFDEDRMHRIYEKFILEYYKREFPEINARPMQIPWQLDNEERDSLLPIMQTDITLSQGEKILIIDAKCYSHSTALRYGVHKLHSANLYQIFTYVKNKEFELSNIPHEVSGMLLYAKTDDEISPDSEYNMSGNKIAVRTLNLDMDFSLIQEQLDKIAAAYFSVKKENRITSATKFCEIFRIL